MYINEFHVLITLKAGGMMSKSTLDNSKEKDIGTMLHILTGDITNTTILKNAPTASGESVEIDTIVNAAKPTLMGSFRGVDGAIHNAIDEVLRKQYDGAEKIPTFNDMIRSELNIKGSQNQILCPRGKGVITRGYGFCDYVIHVVGSKYDIGTINEPLSFVDKYLIQHEICSSSRIRILESCYHEIVKILRKYPDIKNIAIPIISSGEYGFPFKMAVKIAIASIGNALLEWQREDEESFNSKSEWIQNIYFFVWNNSEDDVKDVLEEYKGIFSAGQQVVWQNSFRAQLQYLVEIFKYDRNRGYFCIARMIRLTLSFLRIFSVYTYLKDLGGGHRWERRRFWVELTVILKIVLAMIIGALLIKEDICQLGTVNIMLKALICYDLVDTITYLISLLLMADVQKPSANVIRSMLLLLFNFIEVSLEMTCLFYCQFEDREMTALQALESGLLGNMPAGIEKEIEFAGDYILYYGDKALKFFFVTLVFGYLAGHMRQRKFKS